MHTTHHHICLGGEEEESKKPPFIHTLLSFLRVKCIFKAILFVCSSLKVAVSWFCCTVSAVGYPLSLLIFVLCRVEVV